VTAYSACASVMFITDCLDGCEPGREAARVVLDQYSDEALHRAEDCPMQHQRGVGQTVLADVLGPEQFGQHRVELQRAALPVASNRVPQHELELRAVEGTLPGFSVYSSPAASQAPFRAASALSTARPSRRAWPAVGELDRDLGEAEVLVHALQQRAEGGRLRVDLVLGAEDVCVVLSERAHAHDPVQRADGSLRWQAPNSAMRSGRSRYDLMPCR